MRMHAWQNRRVYKYFSILAVMSTFTIGCGSDDDGGSGGGGDGGVALSGTLSVTAGMQSCRVSTQDFESTGEFSVLCQSEASELVQATFKDETSARTPQSFTFIAPYGLEHPDASTVSVTYRSETDSVVTSSDSTSGGTAVVTVSGSSRVLTLTNVTTTGISGDAATVFATIMF